MNFSTVMDKDKVSKRIRDSKVFLKYTRENIAEKIEKYHVELGLSKEAYLHFFTEETYCPEYNGYHFMTLAPGNKMVPFIVDKVLPKLNVGCFGSIFTGGELTDEGVEFTVTMNDHNPVTGVQKIYYFDIATMSEC